LTLRRGASRLAGPSALEEAHQQYDSALELLTQDPTSYSTSGFYSMTGGPSGSVDGSAAASYATNPGQLYLDLSGQGTIVSTAPVFVGIQTVALSATTTQGNLTIHYSGVAVTDLYAVNATVTCGP
jgi:hypothetical protein